MVLVIQILDITKPSN